MKNNQNHLAEIKIVDKSDLRSFNFGWIKLTDHFVSTVGPSAGQGKPNGSLLVLADAEIEPGASFPLHSHSQMEILTWVVKGTLHHKDDKGGDQFVNSTGLQLMSARDGISHAEGNSSEQPLRLLQIWIRPSRSINGKALVQQTDIKQKGFQLLAGKEGAPLLIEANVKLWASLLDNENFNFDIDKNSSAYAVSIGGLNWNGIDIEDGAGIFLSDGLIEVKGTGQAIIIIKTK
ncbi:MAG: pirin family protein [Bacteriovoracaceae bacterium]|nr:pirin family protein [Bacteriovoracaceae bacterium]